MSTKELSKEKLKIYKNLEKDQIKTGLLTPLFLDVYFMTKQTPKNTRIGFGDSYTASGIENLLIVILLV